MTFQRRRGIDVQDAEDAPRLPRATSNHGNDRKSGSLNIAYQAPADDVSDHSFGRFDYFFLDAEADHRTGQSGNVQRLGIQTEVAFRVWQAGTDAAAAWLAGEAAKWMAHPLAIATGEDDAPLLPPAAFAPPVLPGPAPSAGATASRAVGPDGGEPLNRSTVTARLANVAGGLPNSPSAQIEEALAGLLIALCDPAQVQIVADGGAPLYARLAARSEPMRRPRPAPVEAVFALLPLAAGRHSLSTLLLVGHRLSMPTAQGVLTTLSQLDGKPFHQLSDVELAQGPGGTLAAESGFAQRSPLAWYLVREAEMLGGPGRLGPLGSRLLAECIIGMVGDAPALDPVGALATLDALWRAAGMPDAAPLGEG